MQTADNQSTSNLPDPVNAAGEVEVTEIAGITQPTILNYFRLLNAEAYAEVAPLFAEEGVLYPPFETGVVGPAAIAYYLETEAKGMRLQPREGITETESTDGVTVEQVQVVGKVQTAMFSVNVKWFFTLNERAQILSARVKLMASPQELLNLRSV
jgi:hypothetical protein